MAKKIDLAWKGFVHYSAQQGLIFEDGKSMSLIKSVFFVAYATGQEDLIRQMGQVCKDADTGNQAELREQVRIETDRYRREHGAEPPAQVPIFRRRPSYGTEPRGGD